MSGASCLALASPMPGQAVATLDQLSWRLVDLTPDDGETPWMTTFDGVYRFRTRPMGQTADIPAGPFPLSAGGVSNNMSEVNVSPDKLETVARYIGAYRFPADFQATNWSGAQINQQTALLSLDPANSHLASMGGHFAISPHTALVLEGKGRISTFADASMGIQSDAPAGQPLSLTVRSGGAIDLQLEQEFWTLDGGSSSSFSRLPDGLGTGPSQDEKTGDFTLTFTNTEASARMAYLSIYMSSWVTASVVPEPSPALLGALGLVGLVMLRHRRFDASTAPITPPSGESHPAHADRSRSANGGR